MSRFSNLNRQGLMVFCGGVLLLLAAVAMAQDGRRWKPIAKDGIHDPESPAASQLQAPADALSKLPSAKGGNMVDWGQALQKGLIAPRAGVDPQSGTNTTVLDMDILLDPNGSLPPVRFSHRVHTQLLDCTNCHPQLFQMQKGASGISKLRIQNGEQCGACHSRVAFPLTDCKRCHNVPWSQAPATGGKR